MIVRRALVVLAVATLTGCGGSGAGNAPHVAPGALVLGAAVAYIGTSACESPPYNCLRGPATPGYDIPVSQSGNPGNFQVSSANPAVALGSIVMQGPGGQGDPTVALGGVSAGTTTLTVTGANGATASLPITVTTIAALTVKLNGLPTATDVRFTVQAPVGAPCSEFQAGYGFEWSVTSSTFTLRNFPAMGAGPSSQCVFSTVEVLVTNTAGTTLADKIFHLAIALGHDNSTTLILP